MPCLDINLSPSTCSPTSAPRPLPTVPLQPKHTSQGCWKLGGGSATVCCASPATPCLRASETLGGGHSQQVQRTGGQHSDLLISGRATEVCAVGPTNASQPLALSFSDFGTESDLGIATDNVWSRSHAFCNMWITAVRSISPAFVARGYLKHSLQHMV